ncbi:hypothetical protein LZ3411_2005 [Levilactobacillus zymae]|uniref:Uncharacterized protein n=1 Tax=Levilactobacillus zymae TaxID=267363 RepID=A0A1Y6JYW2_9LACO|nr:hypothetical protein LZ3411_2005 [Levilactobacillus zymae]
MHIRINFTIYHINKIIVMKLTGDKKESNHVKPIGLLSLHHSDNLPVS